MDFLIEAMSWFHKGGPVMYLLILSSLVVVTILVERFVYYRKMDLDVAGFSEYIVSGFQNKEYEAIYQSCSVSAKPAHKIVIAALDAQKMGRNITTAMESSAQLAVAHLRKGLSILSTVVTLSPLFGLLGTVVGMIQSFSVFSLESGQPMAITGGVGEALIATATGLSVAVLALLGHSYFSYRLDGFITDLEQIAGEVEKNLPNVTDEKGVNHEAA